MTDGGPKRAGAGFRGAAACPEMNLPGELAAVGLPRDLSHDFRTPLNIIIGFSELLLEEIPGKINDEQRLDLTDILNAGKRLLGLVNTMLERVEGGELDEPQTALPILTREQT